MFVAGKVRPTSVLDRTGHPQGVWSTVLTQRCLVTCKTAGHVQLHHALIADQILDRAKMATTAVTTRTYLLPLLQANCSHTPFLHNAQATISF